VPIVIDATAGGAAANSYEDEAAATAYFAERLGGDAWAGIDAERQKKALITAAIVIDAFPLRGRKSSSTQRRQWPRVGTYLAGHALDTGIVPEFVKHAQFEQAFSLLVASGTDGTTDPLAPAGTEAFKSIKVGDIALEMRDAERDGVAAADDPRNVLAPAAYRLLAAYFLPLTTDSGPTVRTFRHARS
jgi:hypothetical protein